MDDIRHRRGHLQAFSLGRQIPYEDAVFQGFALEAVLHGAGLVPDELARGIGDGAVIGVGQRHPVMRGDGAHFMKEARHHGFRIRIGEEAVERDARQARGHVEHHIPGEFLPDLRADGGCRLALDAGAAQQQVDACDALARGAVLLPEHDLAEGGLVDVSGRGDLRPDAAIASDHAMCAKGLRHKRIVSDAVLDGQDLGVRTHRTRQLTDRAGGIHRFHTHHNQIRCLAEGAGIGVRRQAHGHIPDHTRHAQPCGADGLQMRAPGHEAHGEAGQGQFRAEISAHRTGAHHQDHGFRTFGRPRRGGGVGHGRVASGCEFVCGHDQIFRTTSPQRSMRLPW